MNELIQGDIIDQFNLPKYINNKSFSEAAEAIEKKFEGKTDKASQDTKEELMERLMKAQEAVKMQQEQLEESMRANSMEVPDMMGGQVPEGMEEFMGDLGVPEEGGGEMLPPEVPQDMINQDIPMGNPMGNRFKKGGFLDNIDSEKVVNAAQALPDSQNMFKTADVGQGILGGAATGASIGSVGGWVGSLIGAGVGALGGGIASGLNKKQARRRRSRQNIIQDHQVNNEFEDNLFFLGGNKTNLSIDPIMGSEMESNKWSKDFNNLLLNTSNPTSNTSNPTSSDNASNDGRNKFNPLNWASNNIYELGRLAPVVGNLTDRVKRSTTPMGARLDNRYQRTPFDTQSLINKATDNNVSRSIQEASGGNTGAARANLTAAGLNRGRVISDAYLQADNINRQERAMEQQFNAGIDQANVQLDNQFIDMKARDDAAYEQARSMRRANIFDNIGKVSERMSNRRAVVNASGGYDSEGNYLGGESFESDLSERLGNMSSETKKSIIDTFTPKYNQSVEEMNNQYKASVEASSILENYISGLSDEEVKEVEKEYRSLLKESDGDYNKLLELIKNKYSK